MAATNPTKPLDDTQFERDYGLSRPLLIFLLGITLIMGVFIPPLVPDADLARITTFLAALLVLFAICVRGHVGRALDNFVFGGIFAIIIAVLFGLRGNLSMEPSLLMFVIGISGLLYRPRTILLLTAASAAPFAIVIALRWSTWVADGTINRNIAAVIGYVSLFFVTGLFQSDLKRSLTNAWLRIRSKERQLAENNRQLEREVSERRAAEMRAYAQSTQLATLVQASTALSSALDRNALIAEIVRQVKSLIGFDTIYIAELQPSNNFKAIHVEGDAGYLETLRSANFEISKEHADLAMMFVTHMPIVVEDIDADTELAKAKRKRMTDYFGHVPAYSQSSLSAPLITGGKVSGVLILNSARRGNYTADMRQFISAIAGMIATSIQRAKLHDRSLNAATLTERSRIARELHDSVSQSLFGIVLGLRTMDAAGAATASRETFDYVFQLAESALNDTRTLVFELRPEYLEREGLIAALKKQASTVCTRHNVNAYLDLGQIEPNIPLNHKEALYRIAIEALQNAIKHARANLVRLDLRSPPGELMLSITDDGVGFDTSGEFAGHFGLSTMRERADAVGGRCTIVSKPGVGTTVVVTMPVKSRSPMGTASSAPQPEVSAALPVA
jgi:signal transduction histidine kinase